MDLPTGDTAMSITIFQLNRIYRDSLRNMMEWMEISTLTYDWKIGIIDAAKVTRSALQNAASIAALFLTTEVVIADAPDEGGMGGGMPDMDF